MTVKTGRFFTHPIGFQDLGGFGLDSLVSRDEHHLRNHLQAQGDNGLKTFENDELIQTLIRGHTYAYIDRHFDSRHAVCLYARIQRHKACDTY